MEQVARLWFALRRLIGQLNEHRAAFDVVRAVTSALEAAGAPIWARRLRSEPAESQADPLIPADWRNAWDWAAAVAFLKLIDDRERLKALADERVRLDVEIRKTFEQLVRERTFYELGRSLTGRARSALMMFATALRKTGKGTGKGAARHRRDARTAMAQCYDAVPCWIMPTWRVAEQRPVRSVPLISSSWMRRLNRTSASYRLSCGEEDPGGRGRQAGEPDSRLYRECQNQPA